MSESELKILEALARYKYLTSSQLDFLKILKNKVGLYQRLRGLRDVGRPFVKCNKFGVYPGKGRLEDFYFLTPKGRDFLIENLEYQGDQIKMPIGTSSLFARDYFHRLETINFYMLLDSFLAKNNNSYVMYLDYYFDKLGNNRKGKNLVAKNRIDLEAEGSYIIPDVITKFKYLDRDYLFFFEQHNGKDTKKLIKQLYYHLIAIEEGSGAKKYNFDRSHRVAVVFEFEGILKSTLERVQKIETFEGFEKFFIFKTSEDLKKDFFNNWIDLNGELTTLV